MPLLLAVAAGVSSAGEVVPVSVSTMSAHSIDCSGSSLDFGTIYLHPGAVGDVEVNALASATAAIADSGSGGIQTVRGGGPAVCLVTGVAEEATITLHVGGEVVDEQVTLVSEEEGGGELMATLELDQSILQQDGPVHIGGKLHITGGEPLGRYESDPITITVVED